MAVTTPMNAPEMVIEQGKDTIYLESFKGRSLFLHIGEGKAHRYAVLSRQDARVLAFRLLSEAERLRK